MEKSLSRTFLGYRAGLGANHSHSRSYGADLQRRMADEGAISCNRFGGTDYQHTLAAQRKLLIALGVDEGDVKAGSAFADAAWRTAHFLCPSRLLIGSSSSFRQTGYMKSRLRPPCVVANPRHSYGYGCGLGLA